MHTLEKYSWLKKINKALLRLDQIPLLRNYAPFNFEEFSSNLEKRFAIQNFKIETLDMRWISKEDLRSSFSSKMNYLSFIMSPLEGNVLLLIDLEDIEKITNELVTKKNHIKFSSTILQESYFRYLTLEALDILSEMNLFQDLSVKLIESIDNVLENSLCIDLKITLNNSTSFCRIAINSKFRKSWESHFNNNPPLKAFEISKALDLTITADMGYVNLNYETLKKLKKGDFLILDKINYDPKTNKGQAVLKLGDLALFHAKIKQNKLKILDFANYQEDPFMKDSEIEKQDTSEENIPVEKTNELPTSDIANLDITIIVEAARFKISLDKLMNLQVGNLIDLAVNPQAGVDLVVNGKKIARAELLNLGETLGVRILDLG
ncbi:MAG: type III secretion system cytoplasmic ring protein SctQ [Parachlamydiales bacterium]|jgi:flagellar motor switch protein FliN/FliY